MSGPSDELAREWAYYGQVIDPIAREMLAVQDAWESYRLANELTSLLTDISPGGSWELAHAGHVYVAWAELADLYDTGKTPIPEAYATLRFAAERWLDRPAEPEPRFIDQWVSEDPSGWLSTTNPSGHPSAERLAVRPSSVRLSAFQGTRQRDRRSNCQSK